MLRTEVRKQSFRLRTYVSLASMCLMPMIIWLWILFSKHPDFQGSPFPAPHPRQSGLVVPLVAMANPTNYFVLVIVTAIFAGTSVSEEAAWGTLRYLLTRPVGRVRLLTVKLAVAAFLTLLAVAIAVVLGLVLGIATHGLHAVTVPQFGLTHGKLTVNMAQGVSFSAGATLMKIVDMTLFIGASMAAILAFSFWISTMVDAPFGAVAAGFGFGLASTILDAVSVIPLGIRQLFPTHYWEMWIELFASPLRTTEVLQGVLVQIPYVLVFGFLALRGFRTKDLTS